MSVNADGISRLCLGTAQLGLDYGVANASGRPDMMACDKLLERAIERNRVAQNIPDARVDSLVLREVRRDHGARGLVVLLRVPRGRVLEGCVLER